MFIFTACSSAWCKCPPEAWGARLRPFLFLFARFESNPWFLTSFLWGAEPFALQIPHGSSSGRRWLSSVSASFGRHAAWFYRYWAERPPAPCRSVAEAWGSQTASTAWCAELTQTYSSSQAQCLVQSLIASHLRAWWSSSRSPYDVALQVQIALWSPAVCLGWPAFWAWSFLISQVDLYSSNCQSTAADHWAWRRIASPSCRWSHQTCPQEWWPSSHILQSADSS